MNIQIYRFIRPTRYCAEIKFNVKAQPNFCNFIHRWVYVSVCLKSIKFTGTQFCDLKILFFTGIQFQDFFISHFLRALNFEVLP